MVNNLFKVMRVNSFILFLFFLLAVLFTGCMLRNIDEIREKARRGTTYTVTYNINEGTETTPSAQTVSASIEMVWIEAGRFTMGSPASEPGRLGDSENPRTANNGVVTLSGFWMGKYQVTQEQWIAVMGSNPSWYHGGSRREPATGEIPGRRPVEQVSWYDAIVFCNRLSVMEGLSPAYRINGNTDPAVWGTVPTISNTTWNTVQIVTGSDGYRLPTEAQWEYACRAGTRTRWNFGETESQLINYAWYGVNGNNMTHQVGIKQPNAWGLYDMHGNVWEWCWDWYTTSYNNAGGSDNPQGAVSGIYRVIRGGSWGNSAASVRSGSNDYSNPYGRYSFIGFRLLR